MLSAITEEGTGYDKGECQESIDKDIPIGDEGEEKGDYNEGDCIQGDQIEIADKSIISFEEEVEGEQAEEQGRRCYYNIRDVVCE